MTDRISSRVRGWTVESLSFAGRFQLINSVTMRMVGFWCSTLILPQAVIKRVEQLCQNFLWQRKVGATRGARVSWEGVRRPRNEDGLGICDLKSWSKVGAIKNISLLLFCSGSLWVACARLHLVKGRCLWTLKMPGDCSKSWRKMSRLR